MIICGDDVDDNCAAFLIRHSIQANIILWTPVWSQNMMLSTSDSLTGDFATNYNLIAAMSKDQY